jgi:hypothetical protein
METCGHNRLHRWLRHRSLLVLQTDNEPRVRDGYTNLSTGGHARAQPTRREAAIYRKNVAAHAGPCPPLPPQDLHRKEGVDGSSPSEGSKNPEPAYRVAGLRRKAAESFSYSRVVACRVLRL